MVRHTAWLGALMGVALVLGPAAAQQPKAPLPPVGSEPANTSASYGDWQLRCQRLGEGAAARRFCEVAQTIQLQGQAGPVAELALGHLPNESVLHLTAVLPPSVSFPSTVHLATGEPSPHAVDLPWRRCLAGGCFADAPIPDDMVRIWRGQAEPARLTFKDATGRDVALPLSFRGLAQALDAMARS